MLKKIITIFMVLCLMIIQPIMVLANDTEESVHIISPEVGEAGKTILSNELFISIYVATDAPLYLTLQKEMPKFTFEEVEIIEDTELMEVGQSDDEVIDVNVSDLLSKRDVVDGYREAKSQLHNAEILLDIAKNRANEVVRKVDEYSDDNQEDYEFTREDQEKIDFLKSASESYQSAVDNYDDWQEKYDRLFIVDVITKKPIEVDPDFPYFEYTINTIDPGQYTLLIYNDNDETIENMSFEIVTEDSVVEKIQASKNIFDKIIDNNVFE